MAGADRTGSQELNEAWRQLTLKGHTRVSITFVVDLAGDQGMGGYATQVFGGDHLVLVASDCRPALPLDDIFDEAVDHLRAVLRWELDHLDPF